MKNLFGEEKFLVSEDKIKKLGQFYTKRDVSLVYTKKLTDFLLKIGINPQDVLFLEPSAGYGCFIDSLLEFKLKVKGYDIEPKHKLTKKKDFLNEDILLKTTKKVVIIGNPPFGKRSRLAIDFFNKSTEYSDIIAFILPNQFKKYSVQSKLDKRFKLVKEYKLPKNSFYTELKNDYDVNSVFQIWTSLNTRFKDRRIRKRPAISHNDFEMYQYNNTKEALKIFNNDFDFGVLGQGYGDYTKLYFKSEQMDKKKHWILFKARNEEILERLKKIDFEKLSKGNTTIPGFRKADVVKEYKKIWN